MSKLINDTLFDELFRLEQKLKEKDQIRFDFGSELEFWLYRAELVARLEDAINNGR